MTKRFTATFGAILLAIVCLGSPAWAITVFVGNEPFEGQVRRVDGDFQFDLHSLALALKYRIAQDENGWLFGGVPVETREDGQRVWVSLKDLPERLVRSVHSPELGVLDLYRSTTGQAGTIERWGGDLTLLYFHASWCPACQAMRGTISELEQSRSLRLVYIDIDERSAPAYRDYHRYFQGDKIPFFVVLNRTGKRLDSFFGFQTYNELRDRLNSLQDSD